MDSPGACRAWHALLLRRRAPAHRWPALRAVGARPQPLRHAPYRALPLPPPAGRELAKFMASVQAMAYGSHNAELTSAMFRRMVESKVGGGGR